MTVNAAQNAPGTAEPGERFRPWRRLASLAWVIARTLLPCPDLIRRCRGRSAARNLVTCPPWPGLAATGTHPAQLAVLRVPWLPRQTRPAGPGLPRWPVRGWTRRPPARVADACTGILASAVAERTGRPAMGFARYADKHLDRALTPLAVLAGAGLGRSVKLTQLGQMRGQLRIFMTTGTYIWSGQAASDPIGVRTAPIPEALADLLPAPAPDIPPPACHPYPDSLAATLAERADPGTA